MLLFQKFNSFVNFQGFLLTQRNVILFSPVSTTCKIKASQSNINWQVRKKAVPFVSTWRVSMEIKNNISYVWLSVQRQRKGYMKDCMLKFILIFALRVDDIFVVEKARRTNQHITVLFNTCVWQISFHLICPRLPAAYILIHKRIIKYKVREGINHFNFKFFYSKAFPSFRSYYFSCSMNPWFGLITLLLSFIF